MKIRLEPDRNCPKCRGLGIYVEIETNGTFARWGISLHACKCVKADLVGKLPKRLLATVIESGLPAEEGKL